MALIKCPECGKMISDKAPSCINCGLPISSNNGSSEQPTAPKRKKRLWWVLLLLLLLIGGGAWFIFGDNKEENANDTYADMIAQGLGRDGVYQVGDYYKRDGKEGVVFEVWDGGRHGKIVSLDETIATWNSAIKWCRNKGDDWYLPAKDELEAIYYNKSAINSTLAKYGTKLGNGAYWSSTESEDNPEFCAWYVYMDVGYTDYGSKDIYIGSYVRAVSTF